MNKKIMIVLMVVAASTLVSTPPGESEYLRRLLSIARGGFQTGQSRRNEEERQRIAAIKKEIKVVQEELLKKELDQGLYPRLLDETEFSWLTRELTRLKEKLKKNGQYQPCAACVDYNVMR